MIIVTYATETGNSETLAVESAAKLTKFGFENECLNIAEIEAGKLSEIETLLAIVSTWGDGEPPVDAEDLYNELKESADIDLKHMEFAILALGDTGYDDFCQFGKDLEAELLRHGANRITPRVDCDVDFEEDYEAWITAVLRFFIERRKPYLV